MNTEYSNIEDFLGDFLDSGEWEAEFYLRDSTDTLPFVVVRENGAAVIKLTEHLSMDVRDFIDYPEPYKITTMG